MNEEKNPNRVAGGKKSYETRMTKLKEEERFRFYCYLLYQQNKRAPSTSTSNATPSTSNATPGTSNTSNDATTKSSYVPHMYGVEFYLS